MNVKLFVCSDMSPLESSNSTSPSHLPAFAITVSASKRAYDTTPPALFENVRLPFIMRVPPGFHTFHLPVLYVTVFARLYALPELSATVSCTVARLPAFTLNSIARPSMSMLPTIISPCFLYLICF